MCRRHPIHTWPFQTTQRPSLAIRFLVPVGVAHRGTKGGGKQTKQKTPTNLLHLICCVSFLVMEPFRTLIFLLFEFFFLPSLAALSLFRLHAAAFLSLPFSPPWVWRVRSKDGNAVRLPKQQQQQQQQQQKELFITPSTDLAFKAKKKNYIYNVEDTNFPLADVSSLVISSLSLYLSLSLLLHSHRVYDMEEFFACTSFLWRVMWLSTLCVNITMQCSNWQQLMWDSQLSLTISCSEVVGSPAKGWVKQDLRRKTNNKPKPNPTNKLAV